ncbi:arabinose-5-phosphate isomerase KdsD [Candidatus Providencia siddallii]|uniref:Arabinose 5-phosphate isomerase n=1 Tax=Candidatus Providencia siddallii TaxID=1715285 RepID=A0ABM9NPE4_9GAMM
MLIFDFKKIGKKVINIEYKAICNLDQSINDNFNHVCQSIFYCKGKIIVMGMGKSGHIGRKIAATFSSTGTPSFFIHPAEAKHGDLGVITKQDIVLAISNSGESDEILDLIPSFKKNKIKLICITNNSNSKMGKYADIHLNINITQEACPLGLAPTTSTTATLIIGDALAIALLTARGFTAADFAISHPGGALGKKHLLLVSDVMKVGNDIPCINKNASLNEALTEINNKKIGMTVICDDDMNINGVFTNSDLHRIFNSTIDFNKIKISDLMTSGGIRVRPDILAIEAMKLMKTKHITSLLVAKNNKLIGVLNIHNLLKINFL